MTLKIRRNVAVAVSVIVVCLSALALVTATGSDANSAFYLKGGDRVVFYGDSITDQRLYTAFVETYVVTRFPALSTTFFHSGWGGDRVSGGTSGGDIDTRLKRDVYAYRPTVMTVMLGMNDGRYRPFEQGLFDTYRNGIAAIVEKALRELPGLRITLIRPSPYDEVTRGPGEKAAKGYNSVMVRFGEAVKEIAEVNRQTVVDFNAPLVDVLARATAADAALATKIIPDRIHPLAAGHLIMAAELLRAWNAPSLVTDVEIDGSSLKVTRAENTQVSAVTNSADPIGLTWTQLDAALPMPIDRSDATIALAVGASDVMNQLNRQVLRVAALAERSYELFIDGKRVGRFSPQQLAAGINLAALETPMTAQAAEVHRLTLQHTALHQTRWRSFQVPYAKAEGPLKGHLQQVLNTLAEAEIAAVAMQHASAQPVAHQYELRAAREKVD